jgi:hypothetical protein
MPMPGRARRAQYGWRAAFTVSTSKPFEARLETRDGKNASDEQLVTARPLMQPWRQIVCMSLIGPLPSSPSVRFRRAADAGSN